MSSPPRVASMEDRTVVLTGANSGIGFATAVALAGAGANLVLGCRSSQRAEQAATEIRTRTGAASSAVRTEPLDLADLESVRAFALRLADLDRIDVLVNNAGLMLDQRWESAQGHELTFAVNHLGPYLLTELLLDQIRAARHGRIVDVASVAHRYALRGIRWDDLDRRERFNGWMVYAESKLANVLHTRELAARLDATDVAVHCLHPGNVATRFGRDGDLHGANDRLLWFAQYVLISPERGAQTPVHLASSPEALRTSGDYWVRQRRHRPARPARDDAAALRLRRLSESVVADWR